MVTLTIRQRTHPVSLDSSRQRKILFVVAPSVFLRHVVLGNFSGPDFTPIGVRRILDAAHDFCLERLALFRQFFHAFRIHIFSPWQCLDVARLSAGIGPQTAAALAEHAGIHFAGASGRSGNISAN